ncbi:hypothetical protein M407DRAFT_18541 [Tulasnella calospora MUT 4182]|uniref:Uncharacterized protein n=1 Tax=Tulasnella calospora MUT 4182 TaxID=1051891 RepID=A0A0C3QJJ6_9AGAM|nr:hypothetical protein M407DRAFT_18541 [Tulasnella calospora MUT 4182]
MAVYKTPIISNTAKPLQHLKGQVATTASNRIGNLSNSNPSNTSRLPIQSTLARSKNRAGARRVLGQKQPSTNAPERVLFARPRVKDDDDDDMDDLNALSDDDDAMSEDWEEGKTLVDNLKNFGIDNSDDALEELLACADELQGPMSAKAKELQQDLIDTLVPAMDHIRIVHGLLENTVEAKYIEAVLEIDKAADEYHEKALQCRAELVKMLEESKASKATLQTLDEQAPEDVENLKVELEKKSKLFAKMDKGKSQDMLLKSLMGGSSRK